MRVSRGEAEAFGAEMNMDSAVGWSLGVAQAMAVCEATACSGQGERRRPTSFSTVAVIKSENDPAHHFPPTTCSRFNVGYLPSLP